MILASSRGAMPLLPLLSALIVVAATVWLLVALSGKILDRFGAVRFSVMALLTWTSSPFPDPVEVRNLS